MKILFITLGLLAIQAIAHAEEALQRTSDWSQMEGEQQWYASYGIPTLFSPYTVYVRIIGGTVTFELEGSCTAEGNFERMVWTYKDESAQFVRCAGETTTEYLEGLVKSIQPFPPEVEILLDEPGECLPQKTPRAYYADELATMN